MQFIKHDSLGEDVLEGLTILKIEDEIKMPSYTNIDELKRAIHKPL